jgi:D-mannonate dehydratase
MAVCYNFKPLTRQARKEVLMVMKDSDKFLAYNKPGYARA